MIQSLNNPRGRIPVVLLLALLAASAALIALGVLLPHEARERRYSESGWIERGSIGLWLGLGAFVLARLPPPTIGSLAGVVACLGAAAREADLHKRFTDYSVMKVGFYFKDEYPGAQRALFGVIFVSLVVSLIIVVIATVQAARKSGRPAPVWLKVAAMGIGLLVVSKAMDRAPGIIKDFSDRDLLGSWSAPLKMLEEGLEMLLPVVFGIAVWLYGTERRERAG